MPQKKKPCSDGQKSKKYEYIRLTFYYNGKQYEVSGKTLEEAVEKKILKKQALENGEIGISAKMTVKRWAYEWLEIYKKGNVTDKVYAGIKSKIDRFILPEIGALRLKDVTDTHLQKIINGRSGYSTSHVEKLMRIIKAMFRQARISRLIVYDPAEGLVMPKTTSGSYRSITPFEKSKILALCETHYAGLWVKTMLYCGLRPGETYALEWRHIDFENRRIYIEQAKESGSNTIKAPKTKAGIRKIPIPAILISDFEKHRGEPFSPVFTQQKSEKRHTESSGRTLWKSFKRALDISMGAKVYRNQIVMSVVAEDLVPYCLRHTYGTELQDAGVPINIAKYLMGHTDVQTTANIYTDTTDETIQRAANQIDARIGTNNGNNNGKINQA